MRKDSSEKLTGNAQFEGYSVDLIYEISRILGFNYTFRLVPDGRYGSYNKQTKEWDGMMKELLDQKADLAIADLTITYDREQAVDFTMPFMNLGEYDRSLTFSFSQMFLKTNSARISTRFSLKHFPIPFVYILINFYL